MEQPAKVSKWLGDSSGLSLVWETGCHPHTPSIPPLSAPAVLCCLFPCSYFKRSLPSRRALWPCWV